MKSLSDLYSIYLVFNSLFCLSGPVIYMQKFCCIWFRFRGGIRMYKNKSDSRKSRWSKQDIRTNAISLFVGNGEWFDAFLFLFFLTVYERWRCVPFPVVSNSESSDYWPSLVAVRRWLILNLCYTWAGYDEMGAKYYLSFRGKKMANDFNITLLTATFLNPLI